MYALEASWKCKGCSNVNRQALEPAKDPALATLGAPASQLPTLYNAAEKQLLCHLLNSSATKYVQMSDTLEW